jgi:hypothetical protein
MAAAEAGARCGRSGGVRAATARRGCFLRRLPLRWRPRDAPRLTSESAVLCTLPSVIGLFEASLLQGSVSISTPPLAGCRAVVSFCVFFLLDSLPCETKLFHCLCIYSRIMSCRPLQEVGTNQVIRTTSDPYIIALFTNILHN